MHTQVNNTLLPLVNGLLKHASLPLPSTPQITLRNTTFCPDDGYLLVATEFTVQPLVVVPTETHKSLA